MLIISVFSACVGISFGVDRIFSITKARLEADKNAAAVRKNEVDVYVMAFGGKGFTGMLKERMSVCSRLWSAGIKAEFLYKVKPKLPAQFKAAETGGVPFAVILGEDEWNSGKVKVKEMGLRDGHPEKEGVEVALDDLVADIKTKLSRRAALEDMTRQAEGLKVVHGVKAEDVASEVSGSKAGIASEDGGAPVSGAPPAENK